MILPGCTLLPHNILPLCIFEQRYRLMLKSALESERMFCIAMRRAPEDPFLTDDEQPDDVHPHMTIGVIRACVANPDGTSNLLLQGLERVRLKRWHQLQPFRIAEVEVAPVSETDHPDLPALREALLERVDDLRQSGWDISPQLIQLLRQTGDLQAVADIAGFHLVRCPEQQQQILATDSVPRRLERLLKALDHAKEMDEPDEE